MPQAIVQSLPNHTPTTKKSRSPSTAETNKTHNVNFALSSTTTSISSLRPKGKFGNSATSSIDTYAISTPSVERIVHSFNLISSREIPPAVQNILNRNNTNYFRSFEAAID